jgi:hypothetical protein
MSFKTDSKAHSLSLFVLRPVLGSQAYNATKTGP